jgi:hypothetical protein
LTVPGTFFSFVCTVALDSSRNASLPIHRGAGPFEAANFFASESDALLSRALRRHAGLSLTSNVPVSFRIE